MTTAPLLLALLAVGLAALAPRLMARRTEFRAAPRASLVAWQAVSVAAILAALGAAPAAVPALLRDGGLGAHPVAVVVVGVVSGVVLVRLLVSGHRVGTRLRALRRAHRDLVDLLARPGHDRVRVLPHPAPTAYCIPGRRSRVVLSQGVLDTLPPDQLDAVLAHEEAHLRARHDLLLEFFTVVHEAVPRPVRSEVALAEVRLLVEALADRAAVRRVGEVTTARALVALAGARAPEGGMPVGGPGAVAARVRLLGAGANRWLPVVAYTYAGAVLALPVVLLVRAST